MKRAGPVCELGPARKPTNTGILRLTSVPVKAFPLAILANQGIRVAASCPSML
jgi:hypothetical protein